MCERERDCALANSHTGERGGGTDKSMHFPLGVLVRVCVRVCVRVWVRGQTMAHRKETERQRERETHLSRGEPVPVPCLEARALPQSFLLRFR